MEIKLPEPNEKQKRFLLDKHKHVAFGGARGGGKSFAVRFKSIMLALKHAGIKIMIVRKSYPELTANHVEPLKQMLAVGTSESCAKYNKTEKEMVFNNGSKILFRYCDTEKDVDRYQGTEVDVLFLDEATQLSEMQIKKIVACVRGVNEYPKRIYYTCNPGGQGHQYIKRLFIDRKYEEGEHAEDYSFIQSLVTDNKALMVSNPDYKRQLEMLPEKLRKAWLEGEWDIFEGQFFEDFKPKVHVIEPFDIPDDWNIFMSYDFGYSKPFSFQWFAVNRENVAYLICEFYGCTGDPDVGVKWSPDQQFKKVVEIENQHPLLLKHRVVSRVADPAIWNAESGESVAETAMKYGILFKKGDNARIQGWMQFHYRLAEDDNGKCMFYVFNTCKHFIRTIPLLTYSETVPEDLDTKQEDHIADSTRYFFMSRPIKPSDVKQTRMIGDDPLNQRMISDSRYPRY